MLILEEACLESKLVDEMVSEAVVVRQAHRAKLRLPAIFQISEEKVISLVYKTRDVQLNSLKENSTKTA